MSRIQVLGMDPSLNNWGLALGTYDLKTAVLDITELAVIQPEVPGGKQVRQNSKDLARAVQLYREAFALAGQVEAVFVEVPVGSQSARAMASYGICVGVLGSIIADIPIYEITPTEVKLATVGNKTASKAQIIDRARKNFPQANWPVQIRRGVEQVIASKAEHMADAIGAIEAGIRLPAFQQTIRLLQGAANN